MVTADMRALTPVRWLSGALPPDLPVAAFALPDHAPIDHVRCMLHVPPTGSEEPAVLAEVLKQAVESSAAWSTYTRDVGVSLQARVIAGQATLSFTTLTDHTKSAVETLASVVRGLSWMDLAAVTARAVAALGDRATRTPPRTTARRLCVTPTVGDHGNATQGAEIDSEPVRPRGAGLDASIVVLLSAAHGERVALECGGPAPATTYRPATQLTHGMSTEGNGSQSWMAWASDLALDIKTDSADQLAAAQLAFFALAGSPASVLFRALRDEFGISYGPRSDIQVISRLVARGWIDVSVPAAHENFVQTCVRREFDAIRLGRTSELTSSAPVLRTALRSVLDTPSGQCDAVLVGLSLGDPWHAWRVSEALEHPDDLASLVPQVLRTADLSSCGVYRVGAQGGEPCSS